MNKEVEIKTFIPALALEYVGSTETATREEKLQHAVLRFFLIGDFFEEVKMPDPMPYVFLKEYIFNKDAFGYEVSARIVWY